MQVPTTVLRGGQEARPSMWEPATQALRRRAGLGPHSFSVARRYLAKNTPRC